MSNKVVERVDKCEECGMEVLDVSYMGGDEEDSWVESVWREYTRDCPHKNIRKGRVLLYKYDGESGIMGAYEVEVDRFVVVVKPVALRQALKAISKKRRKGMAVEMEVEMGAVIKVNIIVRTATKEDLEAYKNTILREVAHLNGEKRDGHLQG